MTHESTDVLFTEQELRVFTEARAGLDPTAAAQRSLKLKLASVLPASAMIATTTSALPTSAPSVTASGVASTGATPAAGGTAVASGFGIKALFSALAVGLALGGAGGVFWERSQSHESLASDGTTSSQEPQTLSSLETTSVAQPTPANIGLPADDQPASLDPVVDRLQRNSGPSSEQPSANKPPAEVTFHEELSFLRRAQDALRAGNPALALGLMTTLDEQLKGGALVSERQVTKVLALCELGRNDEASRLAGVLLTSAPNSVYATRIQASCAKPK